MKAMTADSLRRLRRRLLAIPALVVLSTSCFFLSVTASLGIDLTCPASYELRENVFFTVSYTNGLTYSAYKVVHTNIGEYATGDAVEVSYHLCRLNNWLVLDGDGDIVQDSGVYTNIAIAADTAYRVYWAQGVGYSGRVPSNLWTPGAMNEKASQWDGIVLITQTLDFLQAVGNVAGASITIVLSGGASEAVKLPVREALKRTAKELLLSAIQEYGQGQVSCEGAYKNALRLRVINAEVVLRSQAGLLIVVILGDEVDFEDMCAFRSSVALAMADGEGGVDGLYRFYDGGVSQYITGVIESADPTGFIDTIEDLIMQDQSLAEAMSAIAWWHAMAEAETSGLTAGALEVRDAFVAANRRLSASVTSSQATYQTAETVVLESVIQCAEVGVIEGAVVNYTVRKSGGAITSGTMSDAGGGQYQGSFSASELGGTGSFTVQVVASKAGYLNGDAVGSFDVISPQVGHDVALGAVSFHGSSAIRPPVGDLSASPGQSIIVNGAVVENLGDYSESVSLYLEVLDDGAPVPGYTVSDPSALSLPAHQDGTYAENMTIDTTGLAEDVYELQLRCQIGGDANAGNNSRRWQIVIGQPERAPEQLPFASYKAYRGFYMGTGATWSPTSPPELPYSFTVSYVDDERLQFEISGAGSDTAILREGNAPCSFFDGDLIIHEVNVSRFPPDYSFSFRLGSKDTLVRQDAPFQSVYGYGGTLAPDDVPSRYKAYFDFYLPSGWTIDYSFLKGYRPLLDKNTIRGYVNAWATHDVNGRGSAVDNFGGSLVTDAWRGQTSGGSVPDGYLVVPDSRPPDLPRCGDVRFGRCVSRFLRTGPGECEAGFGAGFQFESQVQFGPGESSLGCVELLAESREGFGSMR